jgi:hypothetical protein
MDKCFLTGCDKNTEWQLIWFIQNYQKHCKLPLVVADFGMSEDMLNNIAPMCEMVLDCTKFKTRKGWFLKINALIELSKRARNICWLDTDCEVLSDPSGVFKYVMPNKLSMVTDHPWTKRRPQYGKWYNSGVVAITGTPIVLHDWLKVCNNNNDIIGDQEALYAMIGGDELKRISLVNEMPHKYNVLRLDKLDNNMPKNICIMHHTGQKGNDEIRRKINNG